MAWLQNLAGHAENLLNKIDQNAATVLSDGNKQVLNIEDHEEGTVVHYSDQEYPGPKDTRPVAISPKSESPILEYVDEKADKNTDPGLIMTSENQKGRIHEEPTTSEKSLKSNHTSASSSSLHNSFIMNQELDILQEKITKLELENQDTNKQLINMQHLYSEMRNENGNLLFQIERLNEQLALAQNEKEQYVARAQRILLEKETLISLKQINASSEESDNIFSTYNEELKKELEFQQEKVKDLTEKNRKLLNDLQSLQMQHQVIQKGLTQSNQSLEKSLLNEKKYRSNAEEDCLQKNKDLQIKAQEIIQLQDMLKIKHDENLKLKDSISKKSKHIDNEEYENRIKSLTQTLMLKQNTLETITTERNALRLQLEKMEVEFKRNVEELKRDKVKIINVQEQCDERLSIPHYMRVSPHDAGVTRRVKGAYTTLDAISVKTGLFLRRYPEARIFVFFYVVILHIWVLTVLLWDAPTIRC